MTPRAILPFLAGLLLAAHLPAQARMTPELLWKLGRVGDPQLSPDEQRVLYHVRRYDLAADSGRTQVFLFDVASFESRQLTTVGSNYGARWSPDGDEIAFLSTRDGAPQIYRMSIDGGEARRVTDHAGGVANLAWSPTGAHFSFTAAVQLDDTVLERHPDLPKADAKVYDDLMVRHWDEWRDGTYSHLFVVPVDGGAATDLMADLRVDTPLKPFGGGEQIAWWPDGESLVYTAKVSEHPETTTNSDLFRVGLDGGTPTNLTDGMPGYDTNPAFSPDGRQLAFLSMERDGYESDRNRVLVRELGSGKTRELTRNWDYSVVEIAWRPDSAQLLATADWCGTRQVFALGGHSGRVDVVTEGRFHFGGLQPASDGAFYALRQRTERPFELVRVDAASARAERGGVALTGINDDLYAELELPIVEERSFEATDGKPIHAWIVKPPDFDPSKTYPMLTYCQGGPQSQVGQWFSYRWNFHLMAARGYVVLGVNRRGLPGFGTEWNEAISRDWGGQAMRDLESATDQMFAEPWIDRDRTAAIGASFGGYTVYWLMGHDQEDRFCAMLAHCGVFNLESMYLTTEELFFVDWDLGSKPWADEAVQRDFDRFSPHRYVDQWDTPLMVIHGQKDYRVPFEQGLAAFQAAQLRGIESRLLYFPAESHWVLSPQNGVLWHREFFAWLDKFCAPDRVAALAEPGAAPRPSSVAYIADDDDRRYELERVDDTTIAQLYADGFDELSLRDKELCYHLANAAIAGRDIFIDQKFEYSLALREILEDLYLHRESMAPHVGDEIERYVKLFWVHNGIHHAISSQKMQLRLSRSDFDAACATAAAAGAKWRLDTNTAYEILTDRMYWFATNKSPADTPYGSDPLLASSNNLYSGVTSADLEGFEERYPLNSRVVRDESGAVVEQVYRAGDPERGIPPGRYAKQLTAVIEHLERATTVAPEPTAEALRHLIRYYETGAVEDWRAFNIAWVKDTDSVVDHINGFVEVYMDVRGQKGSWEAVVSFLDPAKTAAIESLAAQAQWFEDRMPWDDEFKKPIVKGIAARAISVVTETGDSGPVTPIGINLPNEADIRENHGSKSVNLANVVAAYDAIESGSSVGEFAWSEEEVARARRWSSISGDIHTNLHEVVGHASGRIRPEIENPASRLGLYYSTLEEGRADLVGLYWIADPRLVEMGIVPHEDAALAEYEAYARNALVQLRRVPKGHRLEEDHMRNRQLVIHWLIENTDAVEVRERDGATYYVVTGVEAFRAGCATLLAEIMRIKATGDFKAGKQLVVTYGTHVDPELHDEVLARIEKLGLSSVTGFVQPEIVPVTDAEGRTVDYRLHYPRDLADQMLRWSGKRP